MNPENGAKFSTYARKSIIQVMYKLLEDYGELIRIPSNKLRKIKRIQYHKSNIVSETGKKPSYEELKKATGYSIEEIRKLHKYEIFKKQTKDRMEKNRKNS